MTQRVCLQVHLPGEEVITFKLNRESIPLETLEMMLARMGKRVPDLSEPQSVSIGSIDSNGEQDFDDFDLPAEKDKFAAFKFQSNSVYTLIFTTTIHIFKLPESGGFDTTNELKTVEYTSNLSNESCLDMLTERLSILGFTVNEVIDASSRPFKDHFFTSEIEREKTYFVGKLKCAYSDSFMTQLISKVELQLGDMIIMSDRIKKNPTLYLDALDKYLHRRIRKPMELAMEEARRELDPELWPLCVKECIRELTLLNHHVMPADTFSAATHRLVINEIVKRVVAYNNATFLLDEQQNMEENRNEDCLGWGPIALSIFSSDGDSLLIVACDEDDSNDEEGESEDEDANSHQVYQMPSSGGTEERSSIDIKTPIKMQDKALARGGCQAHDLMILYDLRSVGMVLCTGHMWRHYVMLRRDNNKPLLVYCGKMHMRVLRNRWATPIRPSGPSEKRPSGHYVDVTQVDPLEVENVMLALHVLMHSSTYLTTDICFDK